ncbi:MAG: hypothetical protein ACREU1_14645, partial [Burkholderiales bacterium]
YDAMNKKGKGSHARHEIVGLVAKAVEDGLDFSLLLDDQFEKERVLMLKAPWKASYLARLSARRLGTDTGRDILFHLGRQISQIDAHMKQVLLARSIHESTTYVSLDR